MGCWQYRKLPTSLFDRVREYPDGRLGIATPFPRGHEGGILSRSRPGTAGKRDNHARHRTRQTTSLRVAASCRVCCRGRILLCKLYIGESSGGRGPKRRRANKLHLRKIIRIRIQISRPPEIKYCPMLVQCLFLKASVSQDRIVCPLKCFGREHTLDYPCTKYFLIS
jgi:hypothetical protein